ncbi:GNAT family N-acetyltransferase [Planctobacterium marinum]|uniref:N-acetyltransferase n=1 Tax=Planctobacterium marinum TaxID=1631968 RepID=A0AA48HL49_9ALTE|nr:N-acetyltransferase [Planctobacterium marinum]
MTHVSGLLRKPRKDEAARLTELALASKQYWGYSDDFIADCRAELRVTPDKLLAAQYRFKLLESAGDIAGFYCLEQHTDRHFEVEALFVAPEYVGCGVGRLLWRDLVAIAQQSGAKMLSIASDPNAENFYLKMGAKRVSLIPSKSIVGRTLPLLEFRL